jgi:hypothetical protein
LAAEGGLRTAGFDLGLDFFDQAGEVLDVTDALF